MQLSSEEFWRALAAALAVFRTDNLDPGNTPQQNVKSEYDFIIVGAGAAGSILANRLSENPLWSVLLIEAGGPEKSMANVPFVLPQYTFKEMIWNYTSVKQAKACLAVNGLCDNARGFSLGGSTTVNGMMYVRGHKKDYDEWAEMGARGWSYDEVFPYFIKSEKNRIPRFQNSSYHGTNGYMDVQYPPYITVLRDEYIKAGKEFGWNFRDYNEPTNDNTIDYLQLNMRGADRVSTSKGYLLPAKNRTNLHIIQRSMVSRIIIENKRATGVEYYREDYTYSVRARKEVIVAAGVIETPKLLMLSGIGPRRQLKKFGIPLVADLPVGQGFQDHPSVSLFYKLNKPVTIQGNVWETNQSINEYSQVNNGPLTTRGVEATAFINPRNKTGVPTFQILFMASTYLMREANENYVQLQGVLVHTESRGSITLNTSNFMDGPLIDPNFFSVDDDYETVELGVKTIYDFMKTPTMAKYEPELTLDFQPNCRGLTNRRLLKCIISQYSIEFYHGVSSARMGDPNDRTTVVGPDLKVLHVEGLRVIDSSVIPRTPRGNTAVPTFTVAEKGADIVKAAYA